MVRRQDFSEFTPGLLQAYHHWQEMEGETGHTAITLIGTGGLLITFGHHADICKSITGMEVPAPTPDTIPYFAIELHQLAELRELSAAAHTECRIAVSFGCAPYMAMFPLVKLQ